MSKEAFTNQNSGRSDIFSEFGDPKYSKYYMEMESGSGGCQIVPNCDKFQTTRCHPEKCLYKIKPISRTEIERSNRIFFKK